MQVLMPRPRKDALEKLGNILSIVNAGFGLREKVQNWDLLDERIKQAKIQTGQLQDAKEGILTPAQFNEIAKGRDITEAQKGELGAMPVKYKGEVNYYKTSKLTKNQQNQLDKETRREVNQIIKERNQHSVTKNTNALTIAFRNIINTDKSGPGDLAKIFNYMKMLDRMSVVRESEQKAAAAAVGFIDNVVNYIPNLLSGKKLTDRQRAEFNYQAALLMKAQTDLQDHIDDKVVLAAKERDKKRNIKLNVNKNMFVRETMTKEDVDKALNALRFIREKEVKEENKFTDEQLEKAGTDREEYNEIGKLQGYEVVNSLLHKAKTQGKTLDEIIEQEKEIIGKGIYKSPIGQEVNNIKYKGPIRHEVNNIKYKITPEQKQLIERISKRYPNLKDLTKLL